MVQEFDKVVPVLVKCDEHVEHHENPLRNWGTWFEQVLPFPKIIAM